MMDSAGMFTVVLFAVQISAGEPWQDRIAGAQMITHMLVDKVVDELFVRAPELWPFRCADIDNTMLGMCGGCALSPSTIMAGMRCAMHVGPDKQASHAITSDARSAVKPPSGAWPAVAEHFVRPPRGLAGNRAAKGTRGDRWHRHMVRASDSEMPQRDAVLRKIFSDEIQLQSRLGTMTMETREQQQSGIQSLQWRVGEDGVASMRMAGDVSATKTVGRVVLYAGEYKSGRPYEGVVPVLIKEYLSSAIAQGKQELNAYKVLLENPFDPKAPPPRSTSPRAEPPLAPVLGSFESKAVEAGEEGTSLWVVQRWDGLRLMRQYPTAQQPSQQKWWPPIQRVQDSAWNARSRFVRTILAGAAEALAYAHRRGVSHGSVDGGAFLLSTFEDTSSESLKVQICNFGSASCSDACSLEDFKRDLRGFGFAALELVFSALSASGASERTTVQALTRLYDDVFGKDLNAFREFCKEDPELAEVVRLLGAQNALGWEMLRSCLAGDSDATNIAQKANTLASLNLDF